MSCRAPRSPRASHVLACVGALLFVPAIGCGDPSPQPQQPARSEVPQGLVLQADPSRPGASTGTFREGDRTLYIEVLRGPPTPEATRRDPTAPQFEMDLRISDQNRQTFYVQQGGSALLDPSWDQDLAPAVDEAGRAADWALVAKLEDALAQADLAAKVDAPERSALGAVARGVRSLEADERAAQAVNKDVTPGEVQAMATTYSHGFRIYKGNMAGPIPGEHSSTRALVFTSSGLLVAARTSCNHGRCWNEDGMSLHCSRSISSGSSYLRLHQKCATGYDALSASGGHNCHDDSRIQNRAWYHNSDLPGDTYERFCGGFNFATDFIYAPACYP